MHACYHGERSGYFVEFPLATGFATNSITADFLYPIIWKAVSIVEVDVGLKVLFSLVTVLRQIRIFQST